LSTLPGDVLAAQPFPDALETVERVRTSAIASRREGTKSGTLADSITGDIETLRECYESWPFFRTTLDDAALSLARTDLDTAAEYADLAASTASRSSPASRPSTSAPSTCSRRSRAATGCRRAPESRRTSTPGTPTSTR